MYAIDQLVLSRLHGGEAATFENLRCASTSLRRSIIGCRRTRTDRHNLLTLFNKQIQGTFTIIAAYIPTLPDVGDRRWFPGGSRGGKERCIRGRSADWRMSFWQRRKDHWPRTQYASSEGQCNSPRQCSTLAASVPCADESRLRWLLWRTLEDYQPLHMKALLCTQRYHLVICAPEHA